MLVDAAVPAARPAIATTNQLHPVVAPLVVTVLFAHRMLAVVVVVTATTQPSVRDAASAVSISC